MKLTQTQVRVQQQEQRVEPQAIGDSMADMLRLRRQIRRMIREIG